MDKLLSDECVYARHLAVPHCLAWALINYEIKNIRSLYEVSVCVCVWWCSHVCERWLSHRMSFNLKLLRIFNFICLLSSTINCIQLLLIRCTLNSTLLLACLQTRTTIRYSEILDYLKAIRLRDRYIREILCVCSEHELFHSPPHRAFW